MTRSCQTSQHHHQIDSREPKQASPIFHGFTLPTILKRCWLSTPDDLNPLERCPLLLPPPSFTEKYGSCQKILHYGTHSSVRLYTRPVISSPAFPTTRKPPLVLQRHVVKIFRPSSSPSVVTSQRFEQALSSAISHPNVCRTLDVLLNERGEMCQVMDYCSGGDLSMLITMSPQRSLDVCTANCFFKQIVRAVAFLHENNIAHCDLKTENILLTPNGAVKVADFGRAQWLGTGKVGMNSSEGQGGESEQREGEEEDRLCRSQSLCQSLFLRRAAQGSCYSPPRKVLGSIAYLPPEGLCPQQGMPDRRAGDVWAIGLIYMAMRCGRPLWRRASEDEDGGYRSYLDGRQQIGGYFPIEELGEVRCRNVIYAMLHPDPCRRIRAADVLRSEWLYNMRLCEAGEMGF
ncbi:serine/threonine protein kinase [Aspergillus steynii IBT 23096]|uniref:non-specific serine/threonine protein kinase n=1 Tax=Aspergillus steynii IBT 23096 TaxID=1392250 RepID=A0A2I2GMW2_9EURO|nr:serine/threonine protein kinase [Aspergillus steynii IBT 23096]PLB54217.1 serine/threonine protein kinase [Aspergillus steynii IBT 23096]